MGPEKVPREISRIEVLVHPFHDIYTGAYGVGRRISNEQLAHAISKWEQRVKEIAKDPNAALVVVKGSFEQSGSPRQTAEEKERLLLMEKEFYQFAKKHLERKGINAKNQKGRLFIIPEKKYYGFLTTLESELQKRKMQLSKKPLFWVYGSYTTKCVKLQFQELDKLFAINRKSKVIPSLSLSNLPLHLRIEGYRPTRLRKSVLKQKKRKKFGQCAKRQLKPVKPRLPK